MLIAFIVFSGVMVGGTVGSFLACARWRIARGIPITGRSFCDACEKPIPFYLNFPIISFLMLGERSRCCGRKLPKKIVIYEVLCAAIGVAIAFLPVILYPASPAKEILLGPAILLGLALLIALGTSILERLYAPKP